MAKIKKKSKSINDSPFKNYWEKNNYIIIGVGFLLLIIGFVLMSQGPWENPISLSISPVVLLIAYLIIFPVAILYHRKKIKNDTQDDTGENKR